jgi:hypothetical protein
VRAAAGDGISRVPGRRSAGCRLRLGAVS